MNPEQFNAISQAINWLAEQPDPPSVARLAGVAGMDAPAFSRAFRRWCGVSPKQYLKSLVWQDARAELAAGRAVMDTAHRSGLSGPGRLHDLAVTLDGMTPGEVAQGGATRIRAAAGNTPFGSAVLGITERGICHLSFHEDAQPDIRSAILSSWPGAEVHHVPALRRELEALFETAAVSERGLFLKGTNFQVRVWEALLTMPAGARWTYTDLAAAAGAPKAVRAAASACAANRIGWLIPCHRVLRANGAPGGYRWGQARKRTMLAWERLRHNPPMF